MATVTSWTESLPAGDTVVYPFVGSEWVWLLIALSFGSHGILKHLLAKHRSMMN